jgi:phosphatidate cytidylyltransferase
MFRTRVITALVGLPLIIGGVVAGGFWFFIEITLIALVAGWEFGRMMKKGGYITTPVLTLGLIILLILYSYRSDVSLDCIIGFVLLVSLIWQLYRTGGTAPTAEWALTLAGGLYIGWGMAHIVALRQLVDGQAWVWLTLVSTWSADSMAYLVGRTWGRHKLWPRHSPKKTWEGLIGSIGGGLLGAAVVAYFSNLNWSTTLLIGAIVPIAALFGDLSISMMKRHVGVKDSSNLVPGHGGVLDRIDSLLFVSVVVYYFAIWSGLFNGLDYGLWPAGLGF